MAASLGGEGALQTIGASGTVLGGLLGGLACGIAAWTSVSGATESSLTSRSRIILSWTLAGAIATGAALVLAQAGELLRTRWVSSIGLAGWIVAGAAGGLVGTWGSLWGFSRARSSRLRVIMAPLIGGCVLAIGVWLAIIGGYVLSELTERLVPSPFSMLVGWFLGGALGGSFVGGVGSLLMISKGGPAISSPVAQRDDLRVGG